MKHKQTEPRARVFISCGQSKGSDEERIASKISRRVKQLGFDPYVAVAEQSLRGLKENIFEQLRKSEYLIFIDFKREVLGNAKPLVHRGSLFSHQELAIASFLDIEVLAFQEENVKRDDGIIRFLQANAIPFRDRRTLPKITADKIRERHWNPNWRNGLVLKRQQREFSDALVQNSEAARFFHIEVHNQHRERTATNCYVYLERVVKLGSKAYNIPLRTVEFKWAGTWLPSVGIGPGASREFDAFYILHEAPTILQFNALTDASDYYPRVMGEGKYELSYVVTAENFPTARGSFILNLNKFLKRTTLGSETKFSGPRS